jgi:hypothetical protein
LDRSIILEILNQKELNVEEYDLYLAVLTWSKFQLSISNFDSLNDILNNEILSLIR